MSRSAARRRELLDAARAFAREAGRLTLEHFGGPVEAEAKADGTPVTRADRGAERLLRERIRERFPGHGVLGEELREHEPDAPIRWILDPIDGTRSFVRGVPLYGVMIGIEIEGEPEIGVIRFPALGETVSAAKGLGCRWNGEPASVSAVDEIGASVLLTTDAGRILEAPTGEGWSTLAPEAAFVRTWGDCYGHCLVATGRAEIMVDPVLSAWDAAALLPILTEAGGRFTDLSGTATVHGGSGLSTNGRLHDEVLARLTAAPEGTPSRG